MKPMITRRNYDVTPKNDFIHCSVASNDQFLGSNGQCYRYECQEWIKGEPCYPELVREEKHGFAICPKCGHSYGKDALTGTEYHREVKR